MKIAFGVNIGSIDNPAHPFARSFDFAQYVAMKRMVFPLWKLRKLYSAEEATFRKSMEVMNEFCYKVHFLKAKLKKTNQKNKPKKKQNKKQKTITKTELFFFHGDESRL